VLGISTVPVRLDPPGEHIRTAGDAGVKLTITTGAHSIAHLGVMPCGTGAAQRGRPTAGDVTRTWPPGRPRAFPRTGR